MTPTTKNKVRRAMKDAAKADRRELRARISAANQVRDGIDRAKLYERERVIASLMKDVETA